MKHYSLSAGHPGILRSNAKYYFWEESQCLTKNNTYEETVHILKKNPNQPTSYKICYNFDKKSLKPYVCLGFPLEHLTRNKICSWFLKCRLVPEPCCSVGLFILGSVDLLQKYVRPLIPVGNWNCEKDKVWLAPYKSKQQILLRNSSSENRGYYQSFVLEDDNCLKNAMTEEVILLHPPTLSVLSM